MAGYRARWATGTALTAVVAAALTTLTGCSDDDSPSDAVSRAASAARSAGAEATAAFASATAEAGRKFDEVKGGVDAKGDVKLGIPATDGDGRTKVEVTVDNTVGSTRSFLVQVDFTDQGGNRVDTVVVTVSDVSSGESAKATARSTRKLGGEVGAKVGRAVRY
ncbi:hypothetical protein ADK57_20465 [Streptomyces sp. MMG1533]|uniref:hypothetical protein n=1 Tax=Streptomyces sp. MMG1533 TaxID=1415546 RepID=UPI0006B00B16|nr:hypothetical protein [Streptomyces sp. MMG1533]KOU63903.1 hypothetical protein ADK57_20465 [Streptomyces sp. MMG1533]